MNCKWQVVGKIRCAHSEKDESSWEEGTISYLSILTSLSMKVSSLANTSRSAQQKIYQLQSLLAECNLTVEEKVSQIVEGSEKLKR